MLGSRYPSSAAWPAARKRSPILDRGALKKMLEAVRSGRLSVAAAGERLKHLPVDELGFASLDTHRSLRRGFPETVYGPGKSIEQIVAIVGRLAAARQTALVTRVGPEVHAAVSSRHPKAEYHEEAKALVLRSGAKKKGRPGVRTAIPPTPTTTRGASRGERRGGFQGPRKSNRPRRLRGRSRNPTRRTRCFP